MSADTEQPDAVVAATPSTPPEPLPSLSQQSMPSTEGPASPSASTSSLKTETNEDRVIPSSLTPPPSSQLPHPAGTSAHIASHLGCGASQRTNTILSPPTTTAAAALRRDGPASTAAEYLPPAKDQLVEASADELRIMFQSCLAENARLKMETAHHKLQYNLLSMQADEEAKRAAVEHEMTRREIQVLRMAEDSRQNRRDLSAAAESSQAKYLQLKQWHEAALQEIEKLKKRAKLAKKVIQQKEDEIISLTDERELLFRRIRENREHFHMLCSPGGAFHGALTPKTPAVATPQQHRATPRQTPRSNRVENDSNQAGFAALLQALSHDNNSAPSTPTSATRHPPRMLPKHSRGVQSVSSLPTTPTARPRGECSALLPSIDLVPQTEPVPRLGPAGRFVPEMSRTPQGRKSRESTISADDNEELARAAIEAAAASKSFLSQASRGSASSRSRRYDDGEEIYESQASQAASEMLRRDPRESFDEVASSVGSRDATPTPAEKTAKLQAKLFAPVNKPGMTSEKRKYGGQVDVDDTKRDPFASPSKKMRYAPGGGETNQRVGLGIRYTR
jgi:acetyl-CoA acyltransferase 1